MRNLNQAEMAQVAGGLLSEIAFSAEIGALAAMLSTTKYPILNGALWGAGFGIAIEICNLVDLLIYAKLANAGSNN